MKKIALISVFNKEGLIPFAQALIKHGYEIWSSGGTAKALSQAGVPVLDVATLVGKPILGHKVVTLSRQIHAGLLCDLNNSAELAELEAEGILPISLMCGDFYPLEEEVAKSEATTASVIDKTDIGGPTMIRSAAKSRRITICDAADRQLVIDWLEAGEQNRDEFVNALAAKAEWVISHYCGVSASYHSAGKYGSIHGTRFSTCKYGENAYQVPAHVYARKGNEYPLAIPNWKLVGGTDLSYNNTLDLARLIQTVTHISAGFEKSLSSVPLIAVGVKHGNACGAAVSNQQNLDATSVVQKMLEGDMRAIHGGLVLLTFQVDAEIAEQLIHYGMENSQKRLLDLVAAPSFSEEAIEILSRKKGKCRLVTNDSLVGFLGKDSLDTSKRFVCLPGGDWIEQPNYTFIPDFLNKEMEMRQFGNEPVSKQIMADMLLGWAIGSTSNSNTITLVRDGVLLGNGVGQQDRVGAALLAISRAQQAYQTRKGTIEGFSLVGAVGYSDSFFPFTDGPAHLVEAGIKAIFTSHGSIHDKEVIDFCHEKEVALYMVADSVGRGFFGHSG